MTNTSTLGQLQSLLHEARVESEAPEHLHTGSTNSVSYVQDGDKAVGHSSDDQLALDDAENPLQLLARASDLRLTSPQSTGTSTILVWLQNGLPTCPSLRANFYVKIPQCPHLRAALCSASKEEDRIYIISSVL